MNITIHRGTDQIGGCVTEYEFEGWKLFVDYGEQLPGNATTNEPLVINGLTCGDLSRSTLLITHYHSDHIGKIAELPAALPILMGDTAKEIAQRYAKHLSGVSDAQKKLAERLPSISTFTPGNPFTFGAFEIMPIVMDHSAFDAYAFKIATPHGSVFHTGDFRTHGFRHSTFPRVLNAYIHQVDYMVCEATNVSRPTAAPLSEHKLQMQFEQAFRESKYNVVYVSSTNIDRLFALYHAAKKAKRLFYVDNYQKQIMDIVTGDSIWSKSPLYRYDAHQEPKVLKAKNGVFQVHDKFKKYLSDVGYVLIARTGAHFDNLLAQMPSEDRRVFLSQWNGYVDSTKTAYNPALVKSLGDNYEYLHTSGHCDMESLKELILHLRPKAVIPIHTDNPQRFADLFKDTSPVILLHDGETFRA